MYKVSCSFVWSNREQNKKVHVAVDARGVPSEDRSIGWSTARQPESGIIV